MQDRGDSFRTRNTMRGRWFSQQLDLFPEALARSEGRAPRRVLMHVDDAGDGEHGGTVCVMACRACGARTGWLRFDSMSKARRGVPCEPCNSRTGSSQPAGVMPNS